MRKIREVLRLKWAAGMSNRRDNVNYFSHIFEGGGLGLVKMLFDSNHQTMRRPPWSKIARRNGEYYFSIDKG